MEFGGTATKQTHNNTHNQQDQLVCYDALLHQHKLKDSKLPINMLLDDSVLTLTLVSVLNISVYHTLCYMQCMPGPILPRPGRLQTTPLYIPLLTKLESFSSTFFVSATILRMQPPAVSTNAWPLNSWLIQTWTKWWQPFPLKTLKA